MIRSRDRRLLSSLVFCGMAALAAAGCGDGVATQNAVVADPNPSGAQCQYGWDNSGAILAPYCDFSGQAFWTYSGYRGNFSYSKWNRSTVQCSDFIFANLSHSEFKNASLNGVSFDSADLRNANLSGANMSKYGGSKCPGNNLGDNVPYSLLTYSDLRGATLTGAKLTGVDLTGAKCSSQTVWTNGAPLPTPAGADPNQFPCPMQ